MVCDSDIGRKLVGHLEMIPGDNRLLETRLLLDGKERGGGSRLLNDCFHARKNFSFESNLQNL